MKIGKLVIGAVVMAVFMFLTDYLWYAVIMKGSGTPLPNERPDMQYDWLWMIIGLLIYGFAFVSIFVQGRGSGSPVSEGARFGIWAALLAWIPMGFVMYSLTTTMPLSEYLTNDVFRLVQMMLMGIIAGYVMGGGGSRGTTVGGGVGKGAGGGDD